MERDYQYKFSNDNNDMFDVDIRQRKAKTIVAVLQEHMSKELSKCNVLNIGGSAGLIDEYLSRYFESVTGIDIDESAINYAKNSFSRPNLSFEIGDAMQLEYKNNQFDVAICSQVYEHVPEATRMFSEIYRVLKPGGCCYFAAGNRLMYNEPHYNLPFLSVLPRPLSDYYLRIMGKGEYYYENHKTYWGLKKLVKDFCVYDFTRRVIDTPNKYFTDYMIEPNSLNHKLAKFISRYAIWLVPGYIWILEKPLSEDG